MIALKSKRELDVMRKGARILARTLKELRQAVEPGVSTLELDNLAEKLIRKQGAAPAFKGYRGFPASLCTSINEEVVHGIPSKRKLRNGDIVSVDIGVIYDGYFSDAARTWPVGKVSDEALSLVRVARQALLECAVKKARTGNRIGDISEAIQSFVESEGYSVVRDFVGHGIGKQMHEEPQVPNFGKAGKGPRLEPGVVLAIEPMVNAGSWQVRVLDNGWTVVTSDGKLSAHYEDTIVVTDGEPESLTLSEV